MTRARCERCGVGFWVVYARPKDYPDKYVARRWCVDRPTDFVIWEDAIDPLRSRLEAMGLVPIVRAPGDDPCIVETWI